METEVTSTKYSPASSLAFQSGGYFTSALNANVFFPWVERGKNGKSRWRARETRSGKCGKKCKQMTRWDPTPPTPNREFLWTKSDLNTLLSVILYIQSEASLAKLIHINSLLVRCQWCVQTSWNNISRQIAMTLLADTETQTTFTPFIFWGDEESLNASLLLHLSPWFHTLDLTTCYSIQRVTIW